MIKRKNNNSKKQYCTSLKGALIVWIREFVDRVKKDVFG